MTTNKLASLIAKEEGKRSQARIGDIREILKIIVKLEVEGIHEPGPNGTSTTPTTIISLAADKKRGIRKVQKKA